MSDAQKIASGNFVAVAELGNDNFHTSIYEADYSGLLIARCNQNGAYPWQAAALLAGLNKKNTDVAALLAAEARGYAAAREQAAQVAEREVPASNTAHAIRQMEPNPPAPTQEPSP